MGRGGSSSGSALDYGPGPEFEPQWELGYFPLYSFLSLNQWCVRRGATLLIFQLSNKKEGLAVQLEAKQALYAQNKQRKTTFECLTITKVANVTKATKNGAALQMKAEKVARWVNFVRTSDSRRRIEMIFSMKVSSQAFSFMIF